MELKTVKVKNPAEDGGFMIINETDFIEGEHELFDPPPTKGPTAAELKALLDAKGIEYKGNASKAELQALLDAAQ